MTTLIELSRDLEELVARTAPSVVAVEHRDGQGSGVIVAGDGYVITNSHVARSSKGGHRIRLSGGEELGARLVGDDPSSDLAVLRVEARDLPSLPLMDQRRLRVGQLVVAIGNPLRFERSVSLGVVSAVERSLPGPHNTPGLLEGLVQTDAAINPGNSGGPLLDATGAVVGINTAIIPFARGIGFAIPAHTASWILPVLMQKGRVERPLLGIQARGEELKLALANDAGQPRAVRVHGVGDGTPAALAGIRRGDLLLTANGSPVFGIDDLQRVMVLSGTPELLIELLRGKERQALSARPDPPRRAA